MVDFDIWHARAQARALQNRSGQLDRKLAQSPVSWGECQDYNASRLRTMSQTKHQFSAPLWKASIEKNRLILDQKSKRIHDAWYDTEYRQSFQINSRAFEMRNACDAPLWIARAAYETFECNLRARRFNYDLSKISLNSWKESGNKIIKNFAARAERGSQLDGKLIPMWDLSYRASLLRFSHISDSENAWYRSIRDRLNRMVNTQKSVGEKFHVNH